MNTAQHIAKAQKHLDELKRHVAHENLAREHRHDIAKLYFAAQGLLARCDEALNPKQEGAGT